MKIESRSLPETWESTFSIIFATRYFFYTNHLIALYLWQLFFLSIQYRTSVTRELAFNNAACSRHRDSTRLMIPRESRIIATLCVEMAILTWDNCAVARLISDKVAEPCPSPPISALILSFLGWTESSLLVFESRVKFRSQNCEYKFYF